MNCRACGTQLPQGAANCPRCGAATPYYDSPTKAAPDDPTFLSLPDVVAPLAPPPPSPQRPRNRIGIIVGVLLLVLLLIGGGVFAWLEYSAASNAAAAAAVATTTAQAHATATASAVAARLSFTAKGTVTDVSSTTTNVVQDGDNQISTRTVHSVISGDITGSFTSEETDILHPDKTVTFSGMSSCTCTVAGKSGTLTWSYTGTSTANGSFQGQFFDLHGTSDLAKLHGQGTFQGQGAHSSYSSELYFDAQA